MEIKYVSYEEGCDKEGFVVSKWTRFAKDGDKVTKETKSFDWTFTKENVEMTKEEFSKLVSVR